MLVLTRKLQEEICIGDNVKISVLKIKGNTVRIGIDAPKDVRVLRGEIPRFDFDPDGIDSEDAGPKIDRRTLGFEHQPIVGDSQADDEGPSLPPSSQLRLLVQQVVSSHAV